MPVSHYDTAKTPASFATIGTSSGTVVAANSSRREVFVCNDHATNTVYLALGATAVSGSGIRLAAGAVAVIEAYTGIITAISTGASTNVCYSEV